MLTVAVLGAVEVRRDGVLLAVPTGKTTELLVRLALDAGSPVRADVLVEDLWGEPVGRNTLQSKVSQLRRALGDRALVPGSGDAYRLVVDRSGVDAFAVVDLAAEAVGRPGRGRRGAGRGPRRRGPGAVPRRRRWSTRGTGRTRTGSGSTSCGWACSRT